MPMLTLRLLLGLLLVCGVAMSSHGQSMLQQKVDDVRASAPSVSHSLLSRVASVSAAHTGSLHYAEHYELSEIALSAMISSPQEALESTTSGSRAAADCLELYIEADYQSYLDNGSSVAQTEAWALSIMNDVSTIYGTIGISLSVSGLLVRTASGPYASSTNKTELRTAFVDELQGNYEGRVALLFSTRDLQGGLAYGIGGYCADYPSFPGPFAVATSMSSTLTPYPSYSFNVQVGQCLGYQ